MVSDKENDHWRKEGKKWEREQSPLRLYAAVALLEDELVAAGLMPFNDS